MSARSNWQQEEPVGGIDIVLTTVCYSTSYSIPIIHYVSHLTLEQVTQGHNKIVFQNELLQYLQLQASTPTSTAKSDVFKTGESFIKIPSNSVAMHWIRGVDITVVPVITYHLSSLKGTTMH